MTAEMHNQAVSQVLISSRVLSLGFVISEGLESGPRTR